MSVQVKRVKTVQGHPAPTGGDFVGNEGLEQGDHPLLNDLILETLFGFVRRYDLIECRLVSKKWNLHTLPQIRNIFKVTIRGSQTNCKPGQDTRRIQNFVELFNANDLGIPFSKFQLGPFCTTDEVGQQFLQLCGETATEIDLNEVIDRNPDIYTVEDVSKLLRYCPNIKILGMPHRLVSRFGNIVKLFPDSMPTFSSLKKITFTFPEDIEKDRLKCCPTSIEELMTAAPSISDISVSDPLIDFEDNENEDNGRNINVVLNCIEKLERESSVQSLKLNSAIIKDIEHLKRMDGVKLKSLTLYPARSITAVEFDTTPIKLATCFWESLEHMDVGKSVNNILMDFPKMPRIKSLTQEIKRNFGIKPVNLNEKFPVLETLCIKFCEYEDNGEEEWDEFFSEFAPCPTIKSISVVDVYMKMHTFHNFLIIFPNLTKLEIPVNDGGVEILRQIWSYMTGLESLIISGYIEESENLYFDSLFTGIPTRALKSIRHIVEGLEHLAVEDRTAAILNLGKDHCRLPSIRNLTKLRDLELKVEEDFHLTDVTAYLAFYSMNHLRHLDIKQCEFTKTCCELLRRETGLETWSFQILKDNKREHIIPPFLLREPEICFY